MAERLGSAIDRVIDGLGDLDHGSECFGDGKPCACGIDADKRAARAELRTLLDCALIMRVLCNRDTSSDGLTGMPTAFLGRFMLTIDAYNGSFEVDQTPVDNSRYYSERIAQCPIVNGLPVLTDAARAALGEAP